MPKNPQEEFIDLFHTDQEKFLNFRKTLQARSFLLGNNKNLNKISEIYANSNVIPEDIKDVEFEGRYSLCKQNITGEKNVVEGPDFLYKLNQDGFRSTDFLEFDKNKNNILFAGCSITFGQGLPEDLVWPQVLMSSLVSQNPEEDFASYNIGIPGVGIFAIYKNILAFIESVGIPNKIFVLFPNISRGFIYSDERSDFIHSDMHSNKDLDSNDYKYIKGYQHMEQLLTVVTLINSLEYLCQSLNIELMWSTWEFDGNALFNELNFKNFVTFKEDPWEKYVSPFQFNKNRANREAIFKKYNKRSLPYWTSARDGHPGACFMQNVANNFLKEISNEDINIYKK
jgi:hypothetical protein